MVKRKAIKWVSSAMLGVSLLSSTPVLAHVNHDGTTYTAYPTEFDVKDPMSWQQNQTDGITNYPVPKHYGIGYTLSGSYVGHSAYSPCYPFGSCMVFCYTFLALKTSSEALGYTPADAFDEAVDAGAYNSGSFIDYEKMPAKSNLELASIDFSPKSNAEIEAKWNEGYLIELMVPLGGGGSHVIIVDKVENGTIYTVDSGNWGDSLDDHYGNNSAIGWYLWKTKDGTPAKDLPVIGEHRDGDLGGKGSKTETKESDKKSNTATEGGGGAWYPNEGDIPNMPTYRDYKEDVKGNATGSTYMDYLQAHGYLQNVDKDFATGSDARVSIAKWKEERETSISKGTITLMRRILMVIGVGIFLVTALLTALYVLDRWNFFGVSIIALLTGGKVLLTYSEKVDKEALNDKKKRYLSDYNVFGWVAFLSLVGLVVVSGIGYSVMSMFVELIMKVLGFIKK